MFPYFVIKDVVALIKELYSRKSTVILNVSVKYFLYFCFQQLYNDHLI